VGATGGAYNSLNLIDETDGFGKALKESMGLIKADEPFFITKQRHGHSDRALLPDLLDRRRGDRWDGRQIHLCAGPERGEHAAHFRPGERYLSEEWKKRQQSGDVRLVLLLLESPI